MKMVFRGETEKGAGRTGKDKRLRGEDRRAELPCSKKHARGCSSLLVPRDEIKKVLIVSIGSDRGLCGGFNSNIGLAAQNFVLQNSHNYEHIGVFVFGRKVKDYLVRRKVDVIKDLTDVKKIDQAFVDMMANELMGLYLNGEYDKIYNLIHAL